MLAHILIVDDEPLIGELIAETLKMSLPDCLIDTTSSSATALERAGLIPYSVVLTDVVMPELNGFQLAARLWQLHPTVRILFMSGSPLAQRQCPPDAFAYLEKPLDMQALLSAVLHAVTLEPTVTATNCSQHVMPPSSP